MDGIFSIDEDIDIPDDELLNVSLFSKKPNTFVNNAVSTSNSTNRNTFVNNAISTKQIVQNTDINKEKQQINESNDASKNIIGSKRDNFVPTTPKFSSAGKKFNFRRTPPLPSAKDTADISVPNINNNINLVRKRYDQGREYYNNVRVSKNTGNVKKIGKTCSMMTKEDRINTCETGVVDARNKLQIPQEKHCVNEILSCRNDNGGTTLPSESTTAAGKTIKSIPRVHSDFSLTTNRPNSTTTDIENSSHLSRSNSTPNFKRQSATSNSENCSTPSYSRQNHLNIEKSIKKLSSFANQGSNVEQTSFKTADDFSKRTENHGLSSNSCSRLAEKTKQSSEGRPKDKDCLNTVQVCTDKDNDSARAKGNFISPTNGLGKADSNSRDGGTFVSPTSRHFNSRKGFVLLDRRKEISATKGPYCSEGKRKSDEFCHSPDVMKITPLKKRKFPGPAGLLPKLSPGHDLDNLSLQLSETNKRRSIGTPKPSLSPVVLAQSEDDDFKKPFWLSLQKETIESCRGLVYHSVAMILRKATQNLLDRGKVPLMCALVRIFSLNGSDASVVLKDPTGEIHGTVHKRALEQFQVDLGPGAGIILKQVSVFSPSPKRHYVNITPSNIVQLYPAELLSCSQASQCSQKSNKTNTSFDSSIVERKAILPVTPKQVKKSSVSPKEKKNFEDLFAEATSWLESLVFKLESIKPSENGKSILLEMEKTSPAKSSGFSI